MLAWKATDRTARRSMAIVLVLSLVSVLSQAPAFAATGSTLSVIVGGSQSPSKSYTWTGWDTGTYCSSPKAAVGVYIRWYITKVESSRAFIEKVYITHKPNRTGWWDQIRLSYGGTTYASKLGIGTVSANTTKATTLTVGKWVPISRSGGVPILVHSVFDPNSVGSPEPISCHGEAVSYNHLFRQ